MCHLINTLNLLPILTLIIFSSNFMVAAAFFLRNFVTPKLDPSLFNDRFWAMTGEQSLPAFATRRSMLYLLAVGFEPFAKRKFPGENIKQHFSLQFQVFCHFYALATIVSMAGIPIVFMWYVVGRVC